MGLDGDRSLLAVQPERDLGPGRLACDCGNQVRRRSLDGLVGRGEIGLGSTGVIDGGGGGRSGWRRGAAGSRRSRGSRRRRRPRCRPLPHRPGRREPVSGPTPVRATITFPPGPRRATAATIGTSAGVRAVPAAAPIPVGSIVTAVTSSRAVGSDAKNAASGCGLVPCRSTTASCTSRPASSALSCQRPATTPPMVAWCRSVLGSSRRASSRSTAGTRTSPATCPTVAVAPSRRRPSSPPSASSIRFEPRACRSTRVTPEVRAVRASDNRHRASAR